MECIHMHVEPSRINNCDICNITDWIHSIERHCPALEQFSCMGNPGIQTAFKNHGPASPTTYAREYILQALPNLKFVDGISRYSFSNRDSKTQIDNRYLTTAAAPSSSCVSMAAQGPDESTSASEKPKITSPTLSFKELFRLKSGKKTNSSGGSSSN